MPDLDPDQVALNVLQRDPGHEGAVVFHGWLAGGRNDPSRQLYTDSGFREWLEISATDILHHIPGDDPLSTNEDKSSTVWVKHEAFITMCRRARAYESELNMEHPAARRPRP